MPLALWAEHYTAGSLRFNKWGILDRLSNYPAEYILFVDIDNHKGLSIPKVNSTFRAMGFDYLACRINETKRGQHFAFILRKRITAIERVAMEAILGDDPMRAAMNFARARNAGKMDKYWRQRWNIFYVRKVETSEDNL